MSMEQTIDTKYVLDPGRQSKSSENIGHGITDQLSLRSTNVLLRSQANSGLYYHMAKKKKRKREIHMIGIAIAQYHTAPNLPLLWKQKRSFKKHRVLKGNPEKEQGNVSNAIFRLSDINKSLESR